MKIQLLVGVFVSLSFCSQGQQVDSVSSKLDRAASIPRGFFNDINKKIQVLDRHLDNQTEKYLLRLERKEAKLRKKLMSQDSASVAEFFNHTGNSYQQQLSDFKSDRKIHNNTVPTTYFPYTDTLKGSLGFLSSNTQLNGFFNVKEKAQYTLDELKHLQDKLANADQVKAFIRQRKDELKQYLTRYTQLPSGIKNAYESYSKEYYYYTEQLRSYREILNDPDKLERTALTVLNKIPAFEDFMKNNSMLASLFPAQANLGTTLALAGLQTRTQIQQVIQTQMSSGPNAQAMFSQSVQNAQSQLSQLRDRILKYGSEGGDVDVPHFEPNTQRTKTFLKRIEYGANLQSTHSTYYFPVTTNMNLSAGYKLNDKSLVGLGVSYIVGWGYDINHIKVSSRGMGLRSFVEVKAKGTFYLTGGFESNYLPVGVQTSQQAAIKLWQQSGLVGVSKVVDLKSNFFKKTKLQLLWDFLSYYQIPIAQPILFRVGYAW